MMLWHNKWNKQIKTGDIVQTHDGRRWYLYGANEPMLNDPEGEIILHSLCENRVYRSMFPRSIGAEWRNE